MTPLCIAIKIVFMLPIKLSTPYNMFVMIYSHNLIIPV